MIEEFAEAFKSKTGVDIFSATVSSGATGTGSTAYRESTGMMGNWGGGIGPGDVNLATGTLAGTGEGAE